MRFEILNSKEKKKVLKLINERFSSNFETDKTVMKIKEKLFLINREIEELDFTRLRIERFGLYFANLNIKFRTKDNVRLSIEGSQIIGKTAKKNILLLNRGQIKKWLLGEDLLINEEQIKNCEPGFVIIKFNNDFFGCGLLKENKRKNENHKEENKNKEDVLYIQRDFELKNYVPKERRLKSFLMS